MTRAGAAWIGGALLAAWLSARADDGTLVARVLPSLAKRELEALDEVAGLRAERSADAIPVAIAGEGEAAAIVRDAVAEDPAYRLAEGPHRIVVELVAVERACALRLALERRGWLVHAPRPTRRRLLPALAVWPALFGLASWARWRDRVVALVVAALLAQAATFAWPWPDALPPGDAREDLLRGPIVAPIVALARGIDELGTALAAGVIALCLVLAWFDHRRSRSVGGRGIVRGLAAVAAVLAYVEALARSGWAASWTTLGGAATLALVLAAAMAVPRVWHAAPKGAAP